MNRSRWVLLALVIAYMLGFGSAALGRGSAEFIIYLVVMILLAGLILGLDRAARFSGGVLWAMGAWGLLHMAGGTVPIPGAEGSDVLYGYRPASGLPRYDQAVHAFGFGAATWLCWEVLGRHERQGGRPTCTVGRAAVVALMGMGLGALNEVVEFAATRILPETGVGGYVNTGWDLVSNTVGAIGVATLLALRYGDGNEKGPIPEDRPS